MSEEEKPAIDLAAIAEAVRLATASAHIHMWNIIGVRPPSGPIHPRLANTQTTVVLLKCTECGLPETVELIGSWTEEQVRKASEK